MYDIYHHIIETIENRLANHNKSITRTWITITLNIAFTRFTCMTKMNSGAMTLHINVTIKWFDKITSRPKFYSLRHQPLNNECMSRICYYIVRTQSRVLNYQRNLTLTHRYLYVTSLYTRWWWVNPSGFQKHIYLKIVWDIEQTMSNLFRLTINNVNYYF